MNIAVQELILAWWGRPIVTDLNLRVCFAKCACSMFILSTNEESRKKLKVKKLKQISLRSATFV